MIVGLTSQEVTTNVTGVSVGGNAFSLLYKAGTGQSGFWYGETPGGTGNVVVSGTSSSSRMAVALWNVEDFVNDAANYTGYTAANVTTLDITPTGQPIDGWCVLGLTQPGNATGSTTWTNMTEHWDANFTGASGRPYSVASSTVTGLTTQNKKSVLSSISGARSVMLVIR
tara:strand:+ start:479 stop:988 length:510 start_codon:yes stop_codon:yes gene_type:complete